MHKKILTAVCIPLAIIFLFLAGLLLFLTLTEYKPAPQQSADRTFLSHTAPLAQNSLTICTWNIGYAGLGKESDFFMDGGKMVDPPSQEIVEENLAGIQSFIQSSPADAWLFQEVDINSDRTGHLDQFSALEKDTFSSAAFAYNFKCPFVPIPFPPMGQIEGGLATMTTVLMDDDPQRVSLPCPFSWPSRTANIKRCLLTTRLPLEGTEKELVLVNLHLEAYESGEGRIAQTKQLLDLIQAEYALGNYVIAGGDFNQAFPHSLDAYPIQNHEKWTPGILEENILPEGWQFAYDSTSPTCRLLDQPYCDNCQLYVIDGFILSPNLQPDGVETVPLNFEHSDHNPVRLNVTLLP